MFLWLVFLPTYFTTFYAIYRAVLLASCLVINAVVTLVCLYIPKIYAVYFVDESRQKVGTIGTVAVAPSNMNVVTESSIAG